MDTINFDWLENDKDIIDSLVASSTVPTNNASDDILQYLLQDNSNNNNTPLNTSAAYFVNNPAPPTTQSSQMTKTDKPVAADQPPQPLVSSAAAVEFRSNCAVVQRKDNFVTFMPVNSTIKKSAAPKKAKFKESIFVTESPENAYKKNKKKTNDNGSTSLSHSSGDENSDDDMMLDEELASSTSPSKLKQMTSKERRQLRNKISARNFRVRRKEYITQLEDKVEEHEKTIEGLKEENSKLRIANEELMKQLLNQPITPPFSGSSDEVLSSASSSGSEGHHSPEAFADPSMFQFQLNDLYDFSLFDQQQQQPAMADVNNLFYLNHAMMPDWDIHHVLGEKGRPITSEEAQQQVYRDLLEDYPLLAPALMSIILRHTLSLEYVTSLAKEFSEQISADLITEKPPKYEEAFVHEEQAKVKKSLHVKGSSQKEQEEEEDNEIISDQDLVEYMLTNCFSLYALMRARGMSHEKVMAKCRECYESKDPKYKQKIAELKAKKKAKEAIFNPEKCKSYQNKMNTLQTYCRVAGSLLKHPQRMTQVSKVLQEEIQFKHTKYTNRAQSQYAAIISPFRNLRITNKSK